MYDRAGAHDVLQGSPSLPLSKAENKLPSGTVNKASIAFFLNMTHPAADTCMAVFNEEMPPEPQSDISLPLEGDLFPDHMDFVPVFNFPFIDHQLMFDEVEESQICSTDICTPEFDARNAAFDNNLEQIRIGLKATFDRATSNRTSINFNDDCTAPSFDAVAVSTLLNPTHVRALVATYFRNTVPDFPVTHEASFSFEDSCPELILATMLSGSLRCAPHDYVLAARKLMSLGVDFIFSRMSDLSNNNSPESPSSSEPHQPSLPRHIIDTVAASLIADSAMATINDADDMDYSCSRVPAERLYQLSSVARTYGLLQARRSARLNAGTDWQQFIHEESCIR